MKNLPFRAFTERQKAQSLFASKGNFSCKKLLRRMKGLIYVWPLGVSVAGGVGSKEGEGKLKALRGFGGLRIFFFQHEIPTLLPFSLSVSRGMTWKRNREV